MPDTLARDANASPRAVTARGAGSAFERALAAVPAVVTTDDIGPLVALVAELRPRDADDRDQATKNLLALIHVLEGDAALAARLRAYVAQLLAARGLTMVLTEVGILPSTGFFTELFRRLGEKLLPAAPADHSGTGLLTALFPERDDHEWVRAVDDVHWATLLRCVAPHRAPGAATADPAAAAIFVDVLDALDILAVRIAALGTEPELARLRRELIDHGSPFLALAAELRRHLDAWHAALDTGGSAPDLDGRHALVLLDQCESVLAKVRRNTGTTGIAVGLTYAMARLDDLIGRTRALLALTDHAPEADRVGASVALLKDLVEADNTRNAIRPHFARNTDLLAREITEHSGRTGEHYITATREEYRAMFRAAAGAGLIVPFMAFAKLGLHGAHAAVLVEGLLYGLNYAAGFVLIQLLHFTLATKQPAMTATRIASALHTRPRQKPDLAELTELIVRMCRSQFIAIVGNVVIALPLALFVSLGVFATTGTHVVTPDKADALLHDLHPWRSLALFHAAIAGVWLFTAGLVSGYWDNKAVYGRIPERIRRLPWLRRVAGDARAARLADYIEHNLGGLAGNIFFGMVLGLTGVVGANLGLPIDIRHVTFAAANIGISIVALGSSLPWTVLAVSVLGMLLVGVVNVTVSFTLAMLLALKARRVQFRHAIPLVALLARRALRTPLDFIRPPREPVGSAVATAADSPSRHQETAP
jgi:site-specific recombinase